MFHAHPSKILKGLFERRSYQGAPPESAKLLFVGLDANFDLAIEASPSFPKVVEYLQDGVAFWHRHGVSHPFLLPDYKGDGRYFHQNFARIGLLPAHAASVCFMELVHVPTFGQSKLVPSDLDEDHLRRIGDAIDGSPRSVFLSDGVARLMRASGKFPWLPRMPGTESPLQIWHRTGLTTVYRHLHFSVWGRTARKTAELEAIGALADPVATNSKPLPQGTNTHAA